MMISYVSMEITLIGEKMPRITIAELNAQLKDLLEIKPADEQHQLLTKLSTLILSTAQQLMNEKMPDIDLPREDTLKEYRLEAENNWQRKVNEEALKEIAQLKQANQNTIAENTLLLADRDALRKTNRAVQAKFQRLSTMYQNTPNAYYDFQITRHKQNGEHVERICTSLREELYDTSRKKDLHEVEIKKLQNQNVALSVENEALKNENARIAAQATDEVEALTEQLRNANDLHRAEIKKLQAIITGFQTANVQLQNENGELTCKKLMQRNNRPTRRNANLSDPRFPFASLKNNSNNQEQRTSIVARV